VNIRSDLAVLAAENSKLMKSLVRRSIKRVSHRVVRWLVTIAPLLPQDSRISLLGVDQCHCNLLTFCYVHAWGEMIRRNARAVAFAHAFPILRLYYSPSGEDAVGIVLVPWLVHTRLPALGDLSRLSSGLPRLPGIVCRSLPPKGKRVDMSLWLLTSDESPDRPDDYSICVIMSDPEC
jgi:hypothetical protein